MNSKNKILLFSFLIIILVLLAFISIRFISGEDSWICQNGQWIRHGNPSSPMPTTICRADNKNCDEQYQAIDQEIKRANYCETTSDCVELPLGGRLIEFGCYHFVNKSFDQDAIFNKMNIYENSCVTPIDDCDIGRPEPSCFKNKCVSIDKIIKVNNPTPNTTISSPLVIEGQARGFWFFEASFPVILLDANNKEIASGIAQSQGDWMTEEFVNFKSELKFIMPETEIGFLVLKKDNPSGLPEKEESLSIAVKFNLEKTKVNVYFSYVKTGENLLDCSQVKAVERNIPKTEAIARATIEELLKGPTESEIKKGYFTNINPEVKIQSLNIENGTAKIDFDENLEKGVGGSCKVTSIRSEITNTLKQFPTVKDVAISINGKTEDVLQP